MGTAFRRIATLAAVLAVMTGCRRPWPERLGTAVPCPDGRPTYSATIGPEGGTVPDLASVDAPSALAEFAAGTFSTPTTVTMTPYRGLHGFHLDFPEEPVAPSPPFNAYFYFDACDTEVREGYRIATRDTIAPAMLRRDAPRQQEQPAGARAAAWRAIRPGELDDDRPDEAGFLPAPPMPIRGGFVVLSN